MLRSRLECSLSIILLVRNDPPCSQWPYAKGDTQTVAALRALRCERRVLLSGTPIQNDLGEFFAVMDFACPGLLGDLGAFKKIFSGPIERSRAGPRRSSSPCFTTHTCQPSFH